MITILTSEEYKHVPSGRYLRTIMESSVVLEAISDKLFTVKKDRYTGVTGNTCDLQDLNWYIEQEMKCDV